MKGRPWQEHEEQYLREHHKTTLVVVMAEELGRTATALVNRMKKLDLSRLLGEEERPEKPRLDEVERLAFCQPWGKVA